MKKILSILLVLTAILKVSAQNDTLFNSAIAAYDSGNFEYALDLFKIKEAKGDVSAVLYYNMGNAAFRSNQLGYAVLYYEKALKLDPGMENAKINLQFVSRYKEDQLESVPELFIRTWIKALVGLFSSGTWALIAAIIFVIALSSALFYIFSSNLGLRKTGFFTSVSCILLFVVALVAGIKQHRHETRSEEAIITASSAVVRSTPNTSGNDLFILHEGTKVDLLDDLSGWQNIRISDGRVGWIEKSALEEI